MTIEQDLQAIAAGWCAKGAAAVACVSNGKTTLRSLIAAKSSLGILASERRGHSAISHSRNRNAKRNGRPNRRPCKAS
jgi:hypothetical protein